MIGMIKKTVSIGLIGSCVLGLVGCHDRYTYDELMTHPLLLKQAIATCQSAMENGKADTSDCQIVMKAANDIQAILDDQQQNPELFGQHLLKQQMDSAQLAVSLQQAQTQLAQLVTANAAPDALQAGQEAVQKAQLAKQALSTQIAINLAVLGLGTPE